MMFTPIPTDIIIGNFLFLSSTWTHGTHLGTHLLIVPKTKPSFFHYPFPVCSTTDSDCVPLLQNN